MPLLLFTLSCAGGRFTFCAPGESWCPELGAGGPEGGVGEITITSPALCDVDANGNPYKFRDFVLTLPPLGQLPAGFNNQVKLCVSSADPQMPANFSLQNDCNTFAAAPGSNKISLPNIWPAIPYDIGVYIDDALITTKQIKTGSEIYSLGYYPSFGLYLALGRDMKNDLNGDGLPDLGFGGSDMEPNAIEAVLFGNKALCGDGFDLLKFYGEDTGNLGDPGIIADLNGDGYDDLIFGDRELGNGRVYIYYGAPNAADIENQLIETSPLIERLDCFPEVALRPTISWLYDNALFGSSIVFNPDTNHLLIGAPGLNDLNAPCSNNEKCGGIFAYEWDDVLNKMNFVALWSGTVGNLNNKRGEKMAIGDYNRNGWSDIHYLHDHNSDNPECIQTYIMTEHDPSNIPIPPGQLLHASSTDMCTISSGDYDYFLNNSSFFFDVNGDGYDDPVVQEAIIRSFMPLDADSRVHIYFGGLSVNKARKVQIDLPGELAGFLFVTDLNEDGKKDLVITTTAHTRIYDGSDLSYNPVTKSFNKEPLVLDIGMLSATALDINGDGVDEIISSGAFDQNNIIHVLFK